MLPVIAQQTVNELELLVVTNTATEPNIHSVTVGYGLLQCASRDEHRRQRHHHLDPGPEPEPEHQPGDARW